MGSTASKEVVYNRTKLFVLSVISLVTAGMVFSIRANIIPDLQSTFFDPIDPAHAAGLVTAVAGVAFLGFAISCFIASPLCDWLGMGALLRIACILHIGGTLVTIFAAALGNDHTIYWVLWGGMLTVGLAHGLVEAVINPLIATLYPEDKTHRLNVLHAWWPGGLIIGGLIGFLFAKLGLSWKMQLATILLPALAYGIMIIGTKFPPTERVAAGVSTGEMLKEATRPLFIVWFICMFLTASSELAPNQWVNAALTRNVGFSGILVLVYVSGLMFVMRHFAGPLAHKFSPVGLLWLSSLFAGAGLFMLGAAHSPVAGVVGATIWGIGVCYMWPTMLGVTSERFPKGGALLLGIMGSAGNFSVYLTLPQIGKIFDFYKQSALPGGVKFDEITAQAAANVPGAQATLDKALSVASSYSFKWVAVLPAVLLVVFGIIWLSDKAKGGYKAVRLTAEAAPEKRKVEV